MNRKFLFWSVVMACCAGSVLTSCSDDTVPENSTPDAPGVPGQGHTWLLPQLMG